ncbi:MAG: YncE family protein, partial [Thermoplasmataceae archaeon]
VMKINGFVNYYQIPLSVSPVSVAYNIKGTQIYFAGKATSGGPGQYMGAWAELYDGTDFLYLYSINLTRVNASSVSGMAVLPSSNLLLVSIKNPNSIAVVTIFSNGDGLSETGNLTQFQSPGQIAFFPSSYYGTFMISEKGLPAGKTWGIDIGGAAFRTTGTSLNATCYYGFFSYSLFSPNYYLFHNSTGTIVISFSASYVYRAYFSLNFGQSRNYALFSNNATGTGASVMSTINNTYLASLPSGTNIKSVAINPNGTLFLAVNQSSCSATPIVTVTDMKTFTQVAKIPLPAEKGCVHPITVNPDGLYAYVGSLSYNLSVISLQTFSVTKVLNVSFDSSCVAFLPNGTEGFSLSADNYGCVGTPRNFTVINTVTNSVIENITNSNLSYSFGAAISPNGSLLAIPSCQNLTIFNTKTLKEVKNFYNKSQYFCFGSDKFNQNGSILYVTANLFSPFPSHVIVYEIYTNNYSVRVLTNTTLIRSGFAFTGNGKYMYFPGSNSGSINNVQELSSVNGSVIATAHVEGGCQYTVTIPASSYYGSVNFKETGLPANVPWSLELNGLKYQSTGSEITAYSYTGAQNYTINIPTGFYLAQNATGSTLVTYKNNTITLSFLAGITFTETGLGANPIWYMDITNLQNSGKINSNTYATNVPLGSFEAIATSPNAQAYYLNFTINRPGEVFMISFKAYYHFSVTQSGLANNNWYLNVTNKSGYRFETYGKLNNLTLNLINGSYSYTISTSQKTYAPSIYSGIFTINGASVTDTVTFKEILYTVYFNETGLPTGTSWYVILNGNNSTSSSSSLALTSTNGTFSFTIGSTSGYKTNESSGYITVNGSNATLRITFYQPAVKNPSGSVIPPLLEYLAVAAVIAIAIIGVIVYKRRNP